MLNENNDQFIRQTLELIRQEIEETVHRLRIQMDRLEDDRARLLEANTGLQEENHRLQARIEELEAARPYPDSEALLTSFGDALQAMQQSLDETAGPVRYALRDLNVGLKTGIVVDEENKVRFRLPSLKETIAPESLSTLDFSLIASAPAAETLDVVRVPQVVGLAVERARERIVRAQLTVGEIEERISREPMGVVLEQYPPGGVVARVGRAVDIVVATRKMTQVPLLINLSREEAKKLLEQAQLRLGSVTTVPGDAPAGTVIRQSVEAQTEVPVDSAIDLVISKGKRVKVPDLNLADQKEAQRRLRAAGLQLGTIASKPSEIREGLVIEQKPDAGMDVDLGTVVNVTLSLGLGEGKEVVPNVVGLTPEEAAKQLTAQGWQFRTHAASKEDIAASPEASLGRVVRQEPAAGVQANKATTTIHLWIALGTLLVTEIDGIGDKRAASLAELGITNVGELSLAKAEEVASALGVGEALARDFVDMASLISKLNVAGLRDEVVEVLVRGADIRSVEGLVAADPDELYNVSLEAIESEQVRVPEEFAFTVEDVRHWIAAAQRHLEK